MRAGCKGFRVLWGIRVSGLGLTLKPQTLNPEPTSGFAKIRDPTINSQIVGRIPLPNKVPLISETPRS